MTLHVKFVTCLYQNLQQSTVRHECIGFLWCTLRHIRCFTRWLPISIVQHDIRTGQFALHNLSCTLSMPKDKKPQTANQIAQRGNSQPQSPFGTSTIVNQVLAASTSFSEGQWMHIWILGVYPLARGNVEKNTRNTSLFIHRVALRDGSARTDKRN